jgi:hypothetical protein
MSETERPDFRERSTWGPGPWQTEPDREEWRHRGVPCLIVRNDHGALCGYVAVPLGRQDAEAWEELERLSHGGLTYGAACTEGGQICHVRQPGEPEAFWFGFDCNHAWDLAPGMVALVNYYGRARVRDEVYRDLSYVKGVCERMADYVANRLASENR